MTRARLARANPDDVDDIEQILGNLAYGLIARFTEGQIEITGILPVLERSIRRLTR